MRKNLLVALATVLALGISARAALAQCAFEHPQKAKKFYSYLVQAYVACGNPGGNSPNSTTEGGVPSCKPTETFGEQVGSPAGTWTWNGQNTSFGIIKMKPMRGPACTTGSPATIAQCQALNPIGQTTDLYIRLILEGVRDYSTNIPAHGEGTLSIMVRATLDDRAGGDMTAIDFPLNLSFQMNGGKADVITSADVLLNGDGKPGLPHCANLEILAITVLDENGTTFAVPGIFTAEHN